MLKIQNLTKKFGSLTAVFNLSFELKQGDFLGFLGPNGAGKTTTIKIIVGLLSPTSGSVLINNIDIQKNPIDAKKQIGYIPDQPFLYDKLTGKEYLFFCGGLFSLNGNILKNKIEELTDLLKIGNWINSRTENYSQGMKQRISVAAGFINEPSIIIVDEPMIGLDPQSAKIVKEVFVKKINEGRTILMSTHSLHIAEEICNKIAIIKEGELIFMNNISSFKEFKEKQFVNLESFFLELTK